MDTRTAHRATLMANNGILSQLNKALELTLRDSLDGLEDFTLQMAYAYAGAQFEILPVDDSTKNNMMTDSSKLQIVNTTVTAPAILSKKRA
jgi:hypothetical protein